MRVALVAFIFLLATGLAACAEELRIGHLETNDDAGLNWLQLHCDRTGNQMRCDMFQTLLLHKQVSDLARRMAKSPDAVTEFKKEFGDTCPQIVASAPKMEETLKTGIGMNGSKVNVRIAAQSMGAIRQLVQTCQDPSLERTQAFFTRLVRQDENTCIVHNDFSTTTFQWNGAIGAWTSQTAPGGPCGTINIGTLKQDPKNHFWNYIEQHIHTNPDGQLFNDQSCKELEDIKLNYTWKSTSLAEHCDNIESDQY